MTIDIGPGATDRNSTVVSGVTYIQLDNPANESGTITKVQIYANTNLAGCKIGTFYESGGLYSSRDYETIGDVTAGSVQTFTVSISCTAGDYLGIYYSSGTLKREDSGGTGYEWKNNDRFGETDVSFNLNSGDIVSIYGYSEASGGTNMQINIGDSWKEIEGLQINISDSWKTIAGMQINIGDSWKTIF